MQRKCFIFPLEWETVNLIMMLSESTTIFYNSILLNVKKYSKLNGVFLIYILNFTQVKVLFGQILTFYLNYFKILATLSK